MYMHTQAAAEFVKSGLGKIDVLVNMAGTMETTMSRWCDT